jgi:hypothetical protein
MSHESWCYCIIARFLRKGEMIVNGVSIEVRHGDLTVETVDCVVNAANSSLDHASGLAGAIRKAGGHSIQVRIRF